MIGLSKIAARTGSIFLAAALCTACGTDVPSRPPPASPSNSPSEQAHSQTSTGSPDSSSVPVDSPPPRASASTAPSPPYRVELGSQVVRQERGTILFGSLPGTVEDAWLEPYLTWPETGLTIDARVACGAFWGRPLGVSSIRITLYRVRSGTLHFVWSVTKRVNPDAMGYLDELVSFKAPGTYRLEVTRGSTLLAWGVAHMGPRCKTNCSGG
jgi:hypothetical protein